MVAYSGKSMPVTPSESWKTVGVDVFAGSTKIRSSFVMSVSYLDTVTLFDIAPTDPASFVAAAGILLGAGIVAALVPAARASRTNPAVALRAE